MHEFESNHKHRYTQLVSVVTAVLSVVQVLQEQGDEGALEERDEEDREAQALDSYLLKKNVPLRGLPPLISPPTAPPASKTPDVRATHIDDQAPYISPANQ